MSCKKHTWIINWSVKVRTTSWECLQQWKTTIVQMWKTSAIFFPQPRIIHCQSTLSLIQPTILQQFCNQFNRQHNRMKSCLNFHPCLSCLHIKTWPNWRASKLNLWLVMHPRFCRPQQTLLIWQIQLVRLRLEQQIRLQVSKPKILPRLIQSEFRLDELQYEYEHVWELLQHKFWLPSLQSLCDRISRNCGCKLSIWSICSSELLHELNAPNWPFEIPLKQQQ